VAPEGDSNILKSLEGTLTAISGLKDRQPDSLYLFELVSEIKVFEG